jgi:Cu/Ag efflux pump CusA
MVIFDSQAWRLNLEMLTDAVLHVAGMRVRPIIMTATATVAGLLPIFLGSGSGSKVMNRIASPMVGGMLSVSDTGTTYCSCGIFLMA